MTSLCSYAIPSLFDSKDFIRGKNAYLHWKGGVKVSSAWSAKPAKRRFVAKCMSELLLSPYLQWRRLYTFFIWKSLELNRVDVFLI